MTPNKDTPVSDNGLCLKACDLCESSGMCSKRRTELGLQCLPTLSYLQARYAVLQQAEHNIAVQMYNNIKAQEENQAQITGKQFR